MKNNKILTIAIPTYNRAFFLEQSLERISYQIKGYENEIELLVSDNCSTDHTQKIVKRYQDNGSPIVYNRNSQNIGADANFIYCFKKASGKYVWILGDDDFLIDGALLKLLQNIRKGDYGLIHLSNSINLNDLDFKIFTNKALFLGEVSFWLTFISGNIVQTKVISKIDFPKYKDTFLSYMLVYISAAMNENHNLIINYKVLEDPADDTTNGGYNIFEVFVTNYLNIIKEFRPKLGLIWYEKEKFQLYRRFIYGWMLKLLINSDHGLRFKTNGWFKIIFKKYWYEPYLYPVLFIFFLKKLRS